MNSNDKPRFSYKKVSHRTAANVTRKMKVGAEEHKQRRERGDEERSLQVTESSNSDHVSKDSRRNRYGNRNASKVTSDFSLKGPRPKMTLSQIDINVARQKFSAHKLDEVITSAHKSRDGYQGFWWADYYMEPFTSVYRAVLNEMSKEQAILVDPTWFSYKTQNPRSKHLILDPLTGEVNRRMPYYLEYPSSDTISEVLVWVRKGMILTYEAYLWILIQWKAMKAYSFSQIPGLYIVFRDLSKILYLQMHNIWITRKVSEINIKRYMLLRALVEEIWNQVNDADTYVNILNEYNDMRRKLDSVSASNEDRLRSYFSWWHAIKYTPDKGEIGKEAKDYYGITVNFIRHVCENKEFKKIKSTQILDLMVQWVGQSEMRINDWVFPRSKNPKINVNCPAFVKRMEYVQSALQRSWDRQEENSCVVDIAVIIRHEELVSHRCINFEGTKIKDLSGKERTKNLKVAELFEKLFPVLEPLLEAYKFNSKIVTVKDNDVEPDIISDNNNNNNNLQPQKISSWADEIEKDEADAFDNFKERSERPEDTIPLKYVDSKDLMSNKPVQFKENDFKAYRVD